MYSGGTVQRIVHLILGIALVTGIVMMIPKYQKFFDVQKERDLIAEKYGTLNIDDKSVCSFCRVETQSKSVFCWRVYVPDGDHQFSIQSEASANMTSGLVTGECDIELIPEFHEQGLFLKQTICRTVDGLVSFGATTGPTSRLTEAEMFLSEHWSELIFLQPEEGKAENGVTVLLTVEIPASLTSEWEERTGTAATTVLSITIIHDPTFRKPSTPVQGGPTPIESLPDIDTAGKTSVHSPPVSHRYNKERHARERLNGWK